MKPLIYALLIPLSLMGGDVWAAKVGADDLKKSAVHSKHIKNGTIKKKDLKPELYDKMLNKSSVTGVHGIVVDEYGVKVRGTDRMKVSLLLTGIYLIEVEGHTFDLLACYWSAAVAKALPDDLTPVAGLIELVPTQQLSDGVIVLTIDATTGQLGLIPFHFTAFCP